VKRLYPLAIVMSYALFLSACGGTAKEGPDSESIVKDEKADSDSSNVAPFEIGSGELITFSLSEAPFIDINDQIQLIVTNPQYDNTSLYSPYDTLFSVSPDGLVKPAISNVESVTVDYTFYDAGNRQLWISASNSAQRINGDLFRISDELPVIGPEINFPYYLNESELFKQYPDAKIFVVDVIFEEDFDDYDAVVESNTGLSGPHFCESRMDVNNTCLVELHIFPEGNKEGSPHYRLPIGKVIETLQKTYKQCGFLKVDADTGIVECAFPTSIPSIPNASMNLFGFYIPFSIPIEQVPKIFFYGWSTPDLKAFWYAKPGLKPIQIAPDGGIYHQTIDGIMYAPSNDDEFVYLYIQSTSEFQTTDSGSLILSDMGQAARTYDQENNILGFPYDSSEFNFDMVNSIVSPYTIFELNSPELYSNITFGGSWEYSDLWRIHVSESGRVFSCNSLKGVVTAIPEVEYGLLPNLPEYVDCDDIDLISDKNYVVYKVSTSEDGDDINVLDQDTGAVASIFNYIGYEAYGSLDITQHSLLLNDGVLSFVGHNNTQGYLFTVNLAELMSGSPVDDVVTSTQIPGGELIDITHINHNVTIDELPTVAPAVTEFIHVGNDIRYVGFRFNVPMNKHSVNDGLSLTQNGEPVPFTPFWAGDTVYLIPMLYPQEYSWYEEAGLPPQRGESYFHTGKTYTVQLNTSTVSSTSGQLMIENEAPNASHDFSFE